VPGFFDALTFDALTTTVIDFEKAMSNGQEIGDLYSNEGVTFDNLFGALGSPTLPEILGKDNDITTCRGDADEVEAVFDPPILRVNFFTATNDDETTVQAFLDGVLVGTETFDTANTEGGGQFDGFVGIRVTDGFDKIVITAVVITTEPTRLETIALADFITEPTPLPFVRPPGFGLRLGDFIPLPRPLEPTGLEFIPPLVLAPPTKKIRFCASTTSGLRHYRARMKWFVAEARKAIRISRRGRDTILTFTVCVISFSSRAKSSSRD
jgi:hypothetical protein